jgi:hypothetical protein
MTLIVAADLGPVLHHPPPTVDLATQLYILRKPGGAVVVRAIEVDAITGGASPRALSAGLGALIGPDDIDMALAVGTDLGRKRAIVPIQLDRGPEGRPAIPRGAHEDVLRAFAMFGPPGGIDVAVPAASHSGAGGPCPTGLLPIEPVHLLRPALPAIG